jgi:hypothetical protein
MRRDKRIFGVGDAGREGRLPKGSILRVTSKYFEEKLEEGLEPVPESP